MDIIATYLQISTVKMEAGQGYTVVKVKYRTWIQMGKF